MIGIHCDKDGCRGWASRDMAADWIVLTTVQERSEPAMDSSDLHFCCLDHAGQYSLANSQPIEVVDL